jgi:UV DNA damage endonuclease
MNAFRRLGFAVKVLGEPGLKSNDSRRWQSKPHLRVSIEYLHAIFDYLAKQQITMYRMSSDVAPYATHPDMPQFHRQVRECNSDLQVLGRRAREQALRLSFHPSQYIVINSPDKKLVRQSARDLMVQADMLDCMELGPEAVVVMHVGGMYDDKAAAIERWIEAYKKLGEPARRRLVLEHDDLRFSAADVLAIHEACGVRLVFDYQHHWCLNPDGIDAVDTVHRILRSWPAGVQPKLHYSSPRTEMREVLRRDRKTKKPIRTLQPPVWTGHADFVNPFEFITFLRSVRSMAFDIMLEAKAKDLALLRLRRDLAQYAPELLRESGPGYSVAPRLAIGEEAMAARMASRPEAAAR